VNGVRLVLSLFLMGLLLAAPGCGKKGPPFLPEKEFDLRVLDLKADWTDGYFVLKGRFSDPDKAEESVLGCRVHYGEYPLERPPCETCPVEFHGYHGFGPEVVSDGGFLCRVSGKKRAQVYFFKVQLIGPEGSLGPFSDQIRIAVK
jgi:hypothetical protein